MRILKEGLHGSTTDGHSLRGFLLSLVVLCWLLDGHGRLALAVISSLCARVSGSPGYEGVNRSPRIKEKQGM
ncbi:hypothetical protein GGR58DRAFT_479884, partial [Xylaria digitata]